MITFTIVTEMILIIMMIILIKTITLIILQGLAKSGAGFQRAEDSSAEHIAQVSNQNFVCDDH